MTRMVVDASVAVKWFLPEPLAAAAMGLLDTRYTLAAPGLLLIEVANALWKRYRRRELDAGEARRILGDLTRAPLEIHPSEPLTPAALDIAVRHHISVYDGLYLALAAGHGCQLVTADRRLYEICRATEMAPWLVWVGELPGLHR